MVLWYTRRYHTGEYDNWVVGAFAQAGELDLQLKPSRYDLLRGCWVVATRGDYRRREVSPVKHADGTARVHLRLDVREACAVQLVHAPMPPAFQRQPVDLGRATFYPDGAAREQARFTLEHASGAPTDVPPPDPDEAVRRLVGEKEEGRHDLPVVELHAMPRQEIEIRLKRRMAEDVAIALLSESADVAVGARVDPTGLHHCLRRPLPTIRAGERATTTDAPAEEFFVLPLLLGRTPEAIAGPEAAFARVPSPDRVTAEFTINQDLLVRWRWDRHPRVRLVVHALKRVDGRSSRAPVTPVRRQVTEHAYRAWEYARVSGEEIDVLLRTGANELEVTLEVLRRDDVAGLGPVLAKSVTRVEVPEWRCR